LQWPFLLPAWNSHCTRVKFHRYSVMQWWACSRGVMRLDCARGKKPVWPPMFEREVFRKEIYCIKGSNCEIVRNFRRLQQTFGVSSSDSAPPWWSPGELCPQSPLACSSLMYPPSPALAGCESRERIVLLLSLLRNNNMATNLQKFTLYCGSRRFIAWDCWTYTSWQVMQRDSDMLIAVSHAHLYFAKRSMSESIAMLPQVWKIHY